MLFLLPLFVCSFSQSMLSRWSVFMYVWSFCLFNLFLRLLDDFFFCYLFFSLMLFSVYFWFKLSPCVLFFGVALSIPLPFLISSSLDFNLVRIMDYLLCISGKRQDIESTFTRGGNGTNWKMCETRSMITESSNVTLVLFLVFFLFFFFSKISQFTLDRSVGSSV